ncbi:MAG: substrate-binding domain-containing protein [Campylobacter sp.]|uniref:substrate-binding domain-containing protein n=1 Tax=Campylobacter sp. TaxID=205 RepID=UPI003618696F
MKKSICIAILLCASLMASECTAVYGDGKTELKLATGSPGELGLLEVLSNEFSKANDTKICWIKAGSGQALELLKNKKIDIAMVHAPKAEISAVKEGWATQRTLIGSNEFFIVGPKSDPAKIKTAQSATEAYTDIAKSQSLFYTRADNSGTHKKELSIWKMANIAPQGQWYEANKDFMLATLLKADKNGAYFMSDSSTWVVAKKDIKSSEILFRGDKYLINTYCALRQNDSDTAESKKSKDFIDFVASSAGQEIIKNYGKDRYGEGLYNDAAYAQKYFISE